MFAAFCDYATITIYVQVFVGTKFSFLLDKYGGMGLLDHPVTMFNFKKKTVTLAGVDQWVEQQPENQKVTGSGSVPSQGTCLGCGPGPQLRGMEGATNRCFSPSISASIALSLKSK